MRAVLLILAVIAVSACVNLPFFQGKVGFGPSSVTKENPDILFDVTAVQPEIKSGRTLAIEYLVQNKHELFDAEKISLNVYDLCLLSGKNDIFTDLVLKPNRTKSTSQKYTVGSIDFDKSCEVKFRGSYKGHFEASQDVAVLTQGEYDLRSQRGTLGEINPLSSASTNAVSASISFLEKQPFVDGDTVHMYIDYANNGNGIIEKLSATSYVSDWSCNLKDPFFADCTMDINKVLSLASFYIDLGCTSCKPLSVEFTLTDDKGSTVLKKIFTGIATADLYKLSFPQSYLKRVRVLVIFDHLQGYFDQTKSKLILPDVYFIPPKNLDGTCNDFQRTGEHFYLKRDLTFTNNKAPRTTCTFTAKASQPLDSKTLSFFADYDYSIDGSIIVKVQPK